MRINCEHLFARGRYKAKYFLLRDILRLLQRSPATPAGQTQTIVLTASWHWPPFWHDLAVHFMSSNTHKYIDALLCLRTCMRSFIRAIGVLMLSWSWQFSADICEQKLLTPLTVGINWMLQYSEQYLSTALVWTALSVHEEPRRSWNGALLSWRSSVPSKFSFHIVRFQWILRK